MRVISRADAKAKGLDRYFTGKACKHGDVAERQTSDGWCLGPACEAAREARRKRHYHRNRDRLLAEKRESYRAQPEVMRSRNREQYRKSSEARREYRKNYYHANKEACKKATKAFHEKNPTWRTSYNKQYWSENRDRLLRQQRKYYEDNKHLFLASNVKRKAALRERIPAWFGEFDEFVMQECAGLARERERLTGIPHHVDHMIPLRADNASGLHCGLNLQVIPASLNMAKGNRMIVTEPFEWVYYLKDKDDG